MNSIIILEQNLGYVECNICGAGYNSVAATVFEDGSYTVSRFSKCYGDVTEEFVDAKFVEEFLERNWFLIATKPARSRMTEFMRDLKAGKMTYPGLEDSDEVEWFDEDATERPSVAAEPASLAWDSSAVTTESLTNTLRARDNTISVGGCDCASCTEARSTWS